MASVALDLQPFWIRSWLYSSISSCQYETIDPLFVAILMSQRVAPKLTYPRFDAPSADRTGPSSRPHTCIMRCGSYPLKPTVTNATIAIRGLGMGSWSGTRSGANATRDATAL